MFPDFHFKITHKCRISSDEHIRCLFNFEFLMGGAYYRVALKKGRRLFQKKKSYSYEVRKLSNSHCYIY